VTIATFVGGLPRTSTDSLGRPARRWALLGEAWTWLRDDEANASAVNTDVPCAVGGRDAVLAARSGGDAVDDDRPRDGPMRLALSV
jgi:hypothetical protein